MEYDEKKIDDAVLALLSLNVFGRGSEKRAWKSLSEEALERLYEQGHIGKPSGGSKSVALTPEGEQRAGEIAGRLFARAGKKAVRAKPAKKKSPPKSRWIDVESSMISAVRYDRSAKTLDVIFNSGAMWRYEEVPPGVYKELMDSGSKGSYMRYAIIGEYPEYRLSRR